MMVVLFQDAEMGRVCAFKWQLCSAKRRLRVPFVSAPPLHHSTIRSFPSYQQHHQTPPREGGSKKGDEMSLIVKLPTPTLHAPVLSTGFAVGACTLFTLSYVGSLYLSPAGRLAGSKDAEGNRMHRDHPSVIRARMKTASLATAITVVATGWIVWVKEVVPPSVSSFFSPFRQKHG